MIETNVEHHLVQILEKRVNFFGFTRGLEKNHGGPWGHDLEWLICLDMSKLL